jgi:hypothetical protein
MKSTKKPCTLCSLPVEIPGFEIETKEGKKDFCCEGCLSIYQLFNQDKLLPTKKEKKK